MQAGLANTHPLSCKRNNAASRNRNGSRRSSQLSIFLTVAENCGEPKLTISAAIAVAQGAVRGLTLCPEQTAAGGSLARQLPRLVRGQMTWFGNIMGRSGTF